MSMAQRKDYLSTISYRDYLMKHGGLGEEALLFYQNRPLGWWCVGADGICALDAWGTGFFPVSRASSWKKAARCAWAIPRAALPAPGAAMISIFPTAMPRSPACWSPG
jgi:hypothetical protein